MPDTITIGEVDIRAVTRGITATARQIDKAMNRAINKTTDRVHSKTIRAQASAHDIPVKAFRPQRSRGYGGRVLKYKRTARRNKAMVWTGYNDMKSGYIGSLKNAPNHFVAFARKYYFRDGFVAQMRSGHRGIFKNTDNGIEEQTVALSQAPQVHASIVPQVSQIFKRVFRQELNYELNVRGR